MKGEDLHVAYDLEAVYQWADDNNASFNGLHINGGV